MVVRETIPQPNYSLFAIIRTADVSLSKILKPASSWGAVVQLSLTSDHKRQEIFHSEDNKVPLLFHSLRQLMWALFSLETQC